jgi:hypothetical protein
VQLDVELNDLPLTSTEHLAAVLKDGGDRGAKFTIGFMKQIASRSPIVPAPETNGIKSSATFARPSTKPEYTCVNCTEKFRNGDRHTHSEKTKHLFCEDYYSNYFYLSKI